MSSTRCSSAIRVSAPKGQQNKAQAFSPGLGVAKNAPRKWRPTVIAQRVATPIPVVNTGSGATCRALLVATSNPGLKLWAMFYNRFAVGSPILGCAKFSSTSGLAALLSN